MLDAMYALGLSVCYDRVIDIRKCLYSQVTNRCIGTGVVVPPFLFRQPLITLTSTRALLQP